MDTRLFMEDIARGAGDITLKYFQNPDLEIITKGDASPVTRADRESEEYLRKRIREHFPNDVILGEEYGEEGSDKNRRWILDPIDGTKSFIHGVPLYGVMIALEDSGIVTNACIHFPALNETVSATRGNGCFWNGERCHVSTVSRFDQSLVLTTNFPRLETVLSKEAFDKMVLSAKVIRGWGDCYGHILVATGRAEIMFDPVVALWDSAPMGVIVEEAGGRAFDFSGKDTIYSSNIITTNGALADEIKRLLNA
jgi:histidinol phosphatase-like enzyme (inositol monophosphatase family)